MKTPSSSSPMQLALWAGAGSLVMASSYLMVLAPIPRLVTTGHDFKAMVWRNSLRLIGFFVPFCIGVVVLWWAERQLRRGIDKEIWGERELELLQRRLAHPLVTGVSLITLLVWLLNVIRSDISHGTVLFWVLFAPSQVVMRLRMLVKPQRVSSGGALQDWRNFKPIRSEHWGDAREGPLS